MNINEVTQNVTGELAQPPKNPVQFLRNIINICGSIIKQGASIQTPERQQLVNELQNICSSCQDTYTIFIKNLGPLKSAYDIPEALADEAIKFSQKPEYRNSFKPDHLCGKVDELLQRLSNNLDPLKYSVAFNRIRKLRQQLQNFKDYDNAFYLTFNSFATQLGRKGSDLKSMITNGVRPTKQKRASTEIRQIVEKAEDEIAVLLEAVNKTQTTVRF